MWEEIRKRQEGFAEIATWSGRRFNLATGGEVRYAKAIQISGSFFHVLGVEPVLGRLLGPADDQPGCGTGGANISFAFWQRNLGGDPSVVGKRLTLDGNSFEVLGVTPPVSMASPSETRLTWRCRSARSQSSALATIG